MSKSAFDIQQDILAFIAQEDQTEEAFNLLALEVFAYQFEHNLPYKKYCQTQKRTPLVVKNWEMMPLMPIQGYKQLTLSTTPVETAEDYFMSSGTTDPTKKSRNYQPSFTIWDASMARPFKQYVLPDVEKLTIFALFPGNKTNRHSSLSRYVSQAIARFGTPNSRIFIDEAGLHLDKLVTALRQAEQKKEPVMLLGASFSYVHLLDYLNEQSITIRLAKNSRVFDTGGFKGQSREVEQNRLYQELGAVLQIDRSFFINMYGMTEISSQCYDQNIWNQWMKQPICYEKRTPAWVKVRVVDMDSLQPVSNGKKGVLAYYDLANWNSCCAILTEDLAVQTTQGFTLLGRAQGSEAKGCSIALDQLLSGRSYK